MSNSINTSRDLFIHRNTLLYRLERISQLLDLISITANRYSLSSWLSKL
ncbi:MAG: helix-turn-helix domain-containing protein [Anaerovoracaceae bacterium]